MLASTPCPPYYAVIFSNQLRSSSEGYEEMANKMLELARQQEGFLGVESARDAIGITVSYWRDQQSILRWKQDAEHILAQQRGKSEWYKSFFTRIALVERDYSFEYDKAE